MIGTLIGGVTVGAVGYMDPVGFDRGTKFMMGMMDIMPMKAGQSLTYEAPQFKGRNQFIYEFGGQGYLDDMSRTQKGFNWAPNKSFNLDGKVTAGKALAPGVHGPIQHHVGAAPQGMLTMADGTTKNVDLRSMAPTGKLAVGMSALGPLMSGYFIASGFAENGFQGAMDAYFLDIATSRAIAGTVSSRTVETVGKGKKAKDMITVTRHVGMLGMLPTGIGAFMGYEMGSSVAGVPGGFVGAGVGAKAGAFIARNPFFGGAMVLGGLAAKKAGEYAVSAVGQVIKEGHRRGKMRHRIDTAGSTAAFFTQNAVTSRGRAFQAMRKSHLNARSALGMEATMTHMNRSYF